MNRRRFLQLSASSALLAGCASAPVGRKPLARVVVIGAGYGGATAARYVRAWSGGAVEVLLVERDTAFISCPTSNLVLGGYRTLAEITRSYRGLTRRGIQVINDQAVAIEAANKRVRLARQGELTYDRLIVSPGIDFTFDDIEGYDAAAQATMLHAWKAGAQTVALRRQLDAMRDGGVYVLAIPPEPYRCPPGPYERACQVASYFRNAKPKSKVIILDANADVTSKGALFKAAWNDLYKGIIEYRGNSAVRRVDAKAGTVSTDFDTVRGDVLNVIPPHRAADIARPAGLVTAANRWCGVNWLTMESVVAPDVHVLGDAILPAQFMPKSGHLANQQAKLAAAAIVETLSGHSPPSAPLVNNTCYSYVSATEAIHVAAVYAYDAQDRTMKVVPGSAGVSAARSTAEAAYAWSWAQSIWDDMFS